MRGTHIHLQIHIFARGHGRTREHTHLHTETHTSLASLAPLASGPVPTTRLWPRRSLETMV